MQKKLFLRLEIAGAFIVFIIATLLHFLYDLSPSVLTALFASVNESIWEHIKIFSVAFIFYSFVELLWARPSFKRFVVAKTVGLFAQGAFIPLAYYSYTFFTQKPVLIADLLIGFTGSVLGFLVSYRLYKGNGELEKYFLTALMFLFLVLMCLMSFSFFPPKAELFRDVVTGEYGIKANIIDRGAVHLQANTNDVLLRNMMSQS
ncbi:MAG: hypothetical protein IJZ54_04205 [Clostridia bacterium]|nr:hypothetical protein [Clostridia bacterium]